MRDDHDTRRLAPALMLIRSRARAALCVCTALVASCRNSGVLDSQGPVSAAERLILLNATGIMLVVVVPVILMTFIFAWRYRSSNSRATYRPDWSYSGKIELVVWAIPAMIVMLLGGVEWIGAHRLDPARPLDSNVKPLRIEVVSMDWKWLFIYTDLQLAAVDQLVVPSGVPLQFTLTSATVMSAFFVPQLGSQIYTMPGMTTHLNLLADRNGEYAGLASHFSGNGFSDMHFSVRAVAQSDFERWTARVRSDGSALDDQAYGRLSRSGSNDGLQTFGAVPPTLFDHILELAAPAVSPRSKGD